MKRLLQINVTANVGSTGRIAEQLGAMAKVNGWDSYIAYGRSVSTSKSKLIRVGNAIDVLYHVLISRLFDKHGLGSRLATQNLVRTIEEIKPDIIHLHNIHGYYLNYKMLFKYLKNANIPVVWTLHDCWTFTGHCAHFVEAGCCKWKVACMQCPLKFAYPKSFVDQSSRNYKLKKDLFGGLNRLTIVPVSNWLQEYVEDSFFKHSHIKTIHNGVDVNTFSPQELSKDSANTPKTVIGVSSVWNNSKGLEDFITLRRLLADDVRIVLVGLDKKQIAQLPSGIEGVERTNSVYELVSMYNKADVFVNPTYADTFPTVNLEALACGIPVITYKTGGSPESVTSETGVVVEQGNLEMLKGAIDAVLQKGKGHYADACRRRAVEYFDKEKCFQQYIDLYNDILANNNNK